MGFQHTGDLNYRVFFILRESFFSCAFDIKGEDSKRGNHINFGRLHIFAIDVYFHLAPAVHFLRLPYLEIFNLNPPHPNNVLINHKPQHIGHIRLKRAERDLHVLHPQPSLHQIPNGRHVIRLLHRQLQIIRQLLFFPLIKPNRLLPDMFNFGNRLLVSNLLGLDSLIKGLSEHLQLLGIAV